jgi:anaerobic magnesium-protoporphyrin IX monomethyl ester cyclase
MPKILLVTLPREGEVVDRVTHDFFKNPIVKYLPLGVLSIAANLKKWDTEVLDASSRGLTVEQTIEEINTIGPDILGLSTVTYRAWAMTEVLKKTNAKFKP